MSGLSRYEYAGPMLDTAYWIELIIVNSSCQLPTVNLPFDLGGLTQRMDEAFILGTIPSHYWGRSVNSVLLDGYIPKQAVETLFRHMERCTGISPEDTLSIEPSSPESVSSVKFAQLLIAWRFLEEAYRLSMNNRLDSDEQRAQ